MSPRIRVGAVSYFNTVPLIWGMAEGDQRGLVDLSYSIPAVCAAGVESGRIDVGLVPVAEIARQELDIVADVGIVAIGAVRSILLVSRVPFGQIRTVAVDSSSRTSVQLARVILRERFGVEPVLRPQEPVLDEMLVQADAALVIGDPALRIDLERLPYAHLDLANEWYALTQLPMVFAAWAAQPGRALPRFRTIARDSYEFGASQLERIVDDQYVKRGIGRALASEYVSRYIQYTLGRDEWRGLAAFYELAGLQEPRSVLS